MKRKIIRAVKLLILTVFLCIGAFLLYFYIDGTYAEKEGSVGIMSGLDVLVTPTEEIVEYEEGFSVVRYDGGYGFDAFLAQGGASSDGELIAFLANNVLSAMLLFLLSIWILSPRV